MTRVETKQKERRKGKAKGTADSGTQSLHDREQWAQLTIYEEGQHHYSSDKRARVRYAAAKRRPQHKPIRFLRPVPMTFDATRGSATPPQLAKWK